MMKVCMVSKHFLPYSGGLEVRVLELARWLVGKGEKVLVLTTHEPRTKSSEVVDGVDVSRSKVWFSLFNGPFSPGVLLDLLEREYDIIDVNLPDPVGSVWAYIASVIRGKPLFVTYHADILKDGIIFLPLKIIYGPLHWILLRRAVRIFVTSPNYAQSSAVLSGFMAKVVVAPSFVDLKRYNPSVDNSKVREKMGLSGRKVVLFVGRLVEYKGLDYLVEAAGMLSDAVFVIVGDGPLRGRLERKVLASGVKNVLLAGHVGDGELSGYYGACDVFVLPSVTRQEAFGLVLVEAMACGKPVVSTNFSGMPYVVDGGGLLVEPRDAVALAEALGKILADSALASDLAEKGVKRVRDFFARDVVCSKISEIYKSSVRKG
ncbi:MAG: glycosyltransferase [Candidatus Altiarchaeota archaeon]